MQGRRQQQQHQHKPQQVKDKDTDTLDVTMPPIHVTGHARPPTRDEKEAEERLHHHRQHPATRRNAVNHNTANSRASDATLNHVG